MTQTYNEEVIVNDNLVVDGTADETQLTVQGHSSQTEPLQSWEDSAGDALAKVTGDGRLQVGSFDAQGAMATDDSLIEVYRGSTDTGKPKRGLHVAGEVEDDSSNALAWSVHELTLSGASTTTGKATALSARVATDGADLETAVGIEVAVDKETGDTIDEAVGLEVADIDQGTENFAIRTGTGTIRFGDLDEGTLQSDSDGDLSVRKDNLNATGAPGTSNDSSQGYQVGSIWIDTNNDKFYICLDASTGSAVWLEPASGGVTGTPQKAWIWDQKSSGADGGSSSAGWNTRDLNTEDDPDNLVSVSSNQFTPVSGDYEIVVHAPAREFGRGRIKLYNATQSSDVIIGQNAYSFSGRIVGTNAYLVGRFTANGTDAYEIRHYVELGETTYGLGVAINDGNIEKYTTVELHKAG